VSSLGATLTLHRSRVLRVLRSCEARHQTWGYLFLLPMFLLLVVFKFIPMIQAFWLSLTDYDLLTPPRFVGFRNYTHLLTDPLFHQSVGATLYYVFGTCIPLWVLALGLALIFNTRLPVKNWLRSAYFMPAVMPVVVYAVIWRFMFHPYGLLNVGLEQVGLGPIDWLSDARAVIPAFILSSEWRFVPYFMIIYLAGLQNVPQEYQEAASIDGASTLQRFRYITLPLLRPTILLVIVISIIQMSKVFVNVLIISGGGPYGVSAAALHLSDGLSVLQDGAGLCRLDLPAGGRARLHPGPAAALPRRLPGIVREAP